MAEIIDALAPGTPDMLRRVPCFVHVLVALAFTHAVELRLVLEVPFRGPVDELHVKQLDVAVRLLATVAQVGLGGRVAFVLALGLGAGPTPCRLVCVDVKQVAFVQVKLGILRKKASDARRGLRVHLLLDRLGNLGSCQGGCGCGGRVASGGRRVVSNVTAQSCTCISCSSA